MSIRRRKGEIQIDYVVAMGMFIVTFAFVVFFLTNYISNSGSNLNQIQEKGIQAQSILFGSQGLPDNWEDGNNTVRVGVVKKLYRIPIYIYSNNSKSDWPIEVTAEFDGIPDRKSITLTNATNSRIPVQIQNVSEPVRRAAVYFVTNLTTGRNLFYLYFSEQNVTDRNYTGLNITNASGSFSPDCHKRINATKISFILCNGNGDGNGSGIRSILHSSQSVEIADNTSIDQPYVAGSYYTGNVSMDLTVVEQGPVFAKYRISSVNNSVSGQTTTVLMNFSFWNSTTIWKVDHVMVTEQSRNKTVLRMNFRNVFDYSQNHNSSNATLLTGTQVFNVTNYTIAITSASNYTFASYIKSNQTFEVGWNSSLAEIMTHGTPTSSNFTIWHDYKIGNMTVARDLFDEINVTVLSKESIDSVGFEKINALSIFPYDNARASLDMGQDHFFIRINNGTQTIFNYGQDQKQRDVYVESGKTLMQRSYGDIEFVTYTIGVWR